MSDVVERQLDDLAGLPAVLWAPADRREQVPVIAIGHGGSGHKRDDGVLAHAHWFVQHAGLAVLAIDGPFHGDRVDGRLSAEDAQRRVADRGVGTVLDEMAADWRAALDASAHHGTNVDAVGFVGLSMGARYGLPFLAALGPRLRVAVLGKLGLEATPPALTALNTPRRMLDDARQVRAPIAFFAREDDELFPIAGQRALFDAIGSTDKELVVGPGDHRRVVTGERARQREFVLSHLRP